MSVERELQQRVDRMLEEQRSLGLATIRCGTERLPVLQYVPNQPPPTRSLK